MKRETFKITFLPDKKVCTAKKGQILLNCAISTGIFINSSCGGDGVCGRCKVIIRKGHYKTEPSGRITPQEREKGYCLACLTSVQGDLEVLIPEESRLDFGKIKEEDLKLLRLKGIYSEAEDAADTGRAIIDESIFAHSPVATKLFLKIPKPTLQDNISDLERLYREIRKAKDVPIMQTGLANIKKLGHLLRGGNWQITATLGKRNETTEIVILEPGDASAKNYGVAFDIGTTTVTAQLVNLKTKKILGTKTTHNGQAVFGSDVITRIIFATEEQGLERLHHAVIDNMNSLIKILVEENNVNLNDVTGVMCAGNTTMTHLLLRVDPTFIRQEPYVSTANFVPVIRAAEAGIRINPRGLLACVPGVSAYVGGDITAGVVASGLSDEKDLTLLIDIGTNGEIVLGNKEWMMAAAASAGPAFEGSGVTCGMRATKGGIQKVAIDKNLEVSVETIGKEKPRGICGSGYIDLIAELFSRGIITKNGQFNKELKSKRLRKTKQGIWEFVVVPKQEAASEADIVITEEDIENLKRSKGAIYAALSMLLRKLQLRLEDVKKIYIAGGFGTYLNIEKSISIGLLPDTDRTKFKFIGNSSLAGAREILLSYDTMTKAEDIARTITYLELSVEPGYMDEYIKSLFFPHTDAERFPSVVK